MVELVDIPIVQPLSEWIWGTDNAVVCLSELPLLSMPCFSQLFTKVLGVAIICGSMLNKVPIMVNMMNSQSAAGISRNSLYGEVMVYANAALYGHLLGHPFTAFGENVSLLLQNVILIIMTWNFLSKTANPVPSQEKILVTIGFLLYFVGVLNFLSANYFYLLVSSSWPVMLYARGSQVFETYMFKSTGNLSIVTTSMNLIGSLIRILTTLKETGDVVVLLGYILSSSLSMVMFVQYWIYLKNTTEVGEKTEKEKQLKKEL